MKTQYIARSAEVAARMIGDEMMIMSARDSTLFTLNETATAIWEAADGATPLGEIAGRISARFEVGPETALQDVETLVQDLAGHGILLLSDQPIVR